MMNVANAKGRVPLPHGLLVSVRSADEAREAAAGGAAIIDVKEPARGPLGRAAAADAAAALAATGDRAPGTLACGELAAGVAEICAHVRRVVELAAERRAAAPVAAKAGPAGLDAAAWQRGFAALAAGLPPEVEAVAVAYADWWRAGSPDPADVIARAAEAGATTILFDTFDKSAPGILAACGPEQVAAWVGVAGRAGLTVALAGRLAAADMATAARLGAGIVGVRSSACRGGRQGRVDRGKVARLVSTLQAARPTDGVTPGV